MSSSKWARSGLVVALLAISLAGTTAVAELDGPASIVYDQYRVPTIIAGTEHDAVFLQGYQHARNRFFQMDLQRRAFSGTLSELVGPSGLPQDVQLRTLGLRRAAERSLPVQTPEVIAWLQAYADGVNAYLADESIPLPLEYSLLETDRDGIPPWTPVDSLTTAKGLAFGLSFDLGDIDRTIALLNFLGVGPILGFNGLQLFGIDLYPTKPFDPTISIPPQVLAPEPDSTPPPGEEYPSYMNDSNFDTMVRDYRDTIAEIPILKRALDSEFSDAGSNWWIAAGSLTESGYPMIANDPHLALDTPSTFYEVHLNVDGGINVTGVSFPGAPGIVLGCNDTICWGATVNGLDVTDVYNEVLLALGPDPTVPTHTLFEGVPEPLQFIPQTFLFNIIGDGVPNNVVDAGIPANSGGVTLVVPRRNNGPIVQTSFDPSSPTPLTGIAVAYTGWSPTQELEAFRRMARATSMQDFKDALQFFDVGAQNWSYADINGNIAYYTSAEVPIRQDLQTLFFPDGLITPALIRDGTNTSKHDWLPIQNPQPHQALGTEILPFAEMPQIENPAAGYVLNANNDPVGHTLDNNAWNQFRAGFNGLFYLSTDYATGYRMGRLQQLWTDAVNAGPLTTADSIALQANNQLLDAEVLSPFLIEAFANAIAPGAAPELQDLVNSDPRLGEAIARLTSWDFSTPTGIDVGFDPGDNPAAPGPPSAAEVEASVAATIYSVWRGQVVQRVIDGTLASLPIPLDDFAPGSDHAMRGLRQLLDNYPINGGTGASLINFFNVPGVPDQFTARDLILLWELQDALDLLASDDFAPAFGNSTDQADYRWGLLHRIVLDHPLSPLLSIPPAGSPANVSPLLPGFARAGGMGALDASAHSARADGLNEFMFGSGPARRFIATMTPDGPEALEVIPGGQSGVPGSPHQADQLALWLVNAYKPLPVAIEDAIDAGVETETFVCGDGVVGPGEECDDGNADDNDGCNQNCRLSPIITCSSPSLPADPETCTATAACDVVATCSGPLGGSLAVGCDSGGPFPLGTTNVSVTCSEAETTVVACPVTVLDLSPPTLSVELTPDELWPPNHRMVDIAATPSAADTCGGTTVVLESVTSSELDNDTGTGDGDTVDDIQGAEIGTGDLAFQLRAERAGTGIGRVYTVTYVATDASGNQTSVMATVTVAHDQGGMTEPILMTLEKSEGGTMLRWTQWTGSIHYNVIRGRLADLKDPGPVYDLGTVTCLEAGSPNENTDGDQDADIPAPGEVFIYFVEFDDGGRSSYGTVSAAKPRFPRAGDCN